MDKEGLKVKGVALAKKPFRFVRMLWRRLITPQLEALPGAPDLFHDFRRLYQHPEVERRPGGWFYKGKFYPDYLTVGGAGHAIFPMALKYCRGKGIDVGAGFWPLPGAVALDLKRGPGKEKIISDISDGTLDYVFSSHCLEHLENWRQALGDWVKKLKPGGIVFLYLPHPDCAIWHPGSPFVGKGHKWIPAQEVISSALGDLDCMVVSRDDGPDAMYSFYICARKEREKN